MSFGIKQRIRRYVANQIAFQLSEEMPDELPRALARKVRLGLGIPAPLGHPLPESVVCGDIDSYVPVFLRKNASSFYGRERALDIGCGEKPRNLFESVNPYGWDIRGSQESSVMGVDLFHEPIPFPDHFFDYVTAYDFIEHIPRVLTSRTGETRFPFIDLMNEIYRVLKPGGLFFSKTPAFPSKEVFQDPTHVNIITEDTFPMYFCSDAGNGLFAKIYGFNGSFTLVSQEWCHCCLLSLLKKQ